MSVPAYNYLTGDAQIALTEFNLRYDAALTEAAIDESILRLGVWEPRRMLRGKYPLPINSIQFRAFEGDMVYSDLYAESVEIIPTPYSAGVEVDADEVEDPRWLGWGRMPEAFATSAMAQPLALLAAVLETPGNSFDGVGFFATNHKVNSKDSTILSHKGANTWSNYGAALTLTGPNFNSAMAYLPDIPTSQGHPKGLRAAHMIVPPVLEQTAKAILNGLIVMDDSGTAGISNINYQAVEVHVLPWLTSAAAWYLLPAMPENTPAWVVSAEPPPALLIKDKTSDLYKDHNRVSIGARRGASAKMLLPHGICKFGA